MKTSPACSRRHFLKLTAGAALAGYAPAILATPPRRLEAIGIQLYTVRDQMKKQGVAGILSTLARFGYRDVEFAGYFGHSAAEIRQMLEGEGLRAPSTHVPLAELKADRDRALEYAAAVGHKYVVVPFINKKERTLDHYKGHIEYFAGVGEACNKLGLRFGYHNHAFEFEMVDGVRPYDLMLDQLDASIMTFTMDLFWVTKAGMEPLDYINRYPGRFELCHVKDMAADGSMVDVGAGTLDFARIFAAREKAGFRHFYVEHDRPTNSLATAENSIRYLSKLEF